MKAGQGDVTPRTVQEAARAQYEKFRDKVLEDSRAKYNVEWAHTIENLIDRDGMTASIEEDWLPVAVGLLEGSMHEIEGAGQSFPGRFSRLIKEEPLLADLRDTRNRMVLILSDNTMNLAGVRDRSPREWQVGSPE